ncbi:MAG TPA: ABC transporter ATP-binding protein [Thermoanaerobaculia bacterium]|nr:ABC transporter ATP-binding protein [Thermoanaerobaculia bacterium]
MTAAIQVESLTKRFGETIALDRLTFSVEPGELFGFIGPDGAGKTTLFRILATLYVPDEGRATVLGDDVVKDLWRLRPRLGYMPGRFSLYPDLSVKENLEFFAAVFGTSIERGYERIAPIYSQIEPFRDRRAGALSGGMKQKLALSCALVHRPELLLLDEPTTGVDAVSRREFWDLLGELKAGGLTIVVSTPYMDEANRCDRVALIQQGRILVTDTPGGITAAFGRPLFAIRAGDRYGVLRSMREFPHVRTVVPFGEALHYTDRRKDVAFDRVVVEIRDFLERKGLLQISVEPAAVTIEDSFMELTAASTERA